MNLQKMWVNRLSLISVLHNCKFASGLHHGVPCNGAVQNICYSPAYRLDPLAANLKRREVVMISDFSEDWKIIYSVEAQSMLFKNHNQVIILTVAVVVGTPGGNLIDEIHLVFLDHIDNINMNF